MCSLDNYEIFYTPIHASRLSHILGFYGFLFKSHCPYPLINAFFKDIDDGAK